MWFVRQAEDKFVRKQNAQVCVTIVFSYEPLRDESQIPVYPNGFGYLNLRCVNHSQTPFEIVHIINCSMHLSHTYSPSNKQWSVELIEFRIDAATAAVTTATNLHTQEQTGPYALPIHWPHCKPTACVTNIHWYTFTTKYCPAGQ